MSAEAVDILDCVFFGRLLQQGANGGCWKALENRISPGKVGITQAGIGAIDPDTTFKGINAERTYRLRRLDHLSPPADRPGTIHLPKTERCEPWRKCRAETAHPECEQNIGSMTRSGAALPLKPVITSLPGTSGSLPRNILTRGAFTRWAVSSVLLMVASPAAASSGFEAPDQSFEPASDNDAPGAIGSDGETIWVIGFRGRVFAYMLATGARDSAKDIDTLAGADNGDANCMWSDRTVLWVSDYEEANLLAHSRGTSARRSGRDINSLNATGNAPSMSGNNHPKGFWSDGAVIRAADHVDQKIFVYDLYTGNRRAGREITGLRAAENGRAAVMWSDGETLWGDDDGDARIYAHDLSSGDRESHLTLSALTLSGVDP